MKNVFICFLTIYSFSLFAQDKMSAFSFVEIDGPVKVELIQSNEHKVEVLDDSDLVSWEINGNSLVVMTKYRKGQDTPTVRIHLNTLKQLHLFGQVILESKGTFENRRMNLQLSSQSIAELVIDTEELDIELKEQSILKLRGNADQVSIVTNHQSILRAKALKSANIEVDANNQSVVNIRQGNAKISSRLNNQSVLH